MLGWLEGWVPSGNHGKMAMKKKTSPWKIMGHPKKWADLQFLPGFSFSNWPGEDGVPPGARLRFLVVSEPHMPRPAEVRRALVVVQLVAGEAHELRRGRHRGQLEAWHRKWDKSPWNMGS